MRIELHTGDREALRPLFELAEDSQRELDAYIGAGEVLVAVEGEERVGHLQLVGDEIKNMAVVETQRGRGVGRALVAAAIERARDERIDALRVATGAADTGNLRFYQRLGFRMLCDRARRVHARERLPARDRGRRDRAPRPGLARPPARCGLTST